jgi:hypothetical protein
MEQSFLLKHYGHVSLHEQMDMTAEERHWWLERLDSENRKERDAANKHTPSKAPPTPGKPPI